MTSLLKPAIVFSLLSTGVQKEVQFGVHVLYRPCSRPINVNKLQAELNILLPLRQHIYHLGKLQFSIKRDTRRIMRLDKLSTTVRLRTRTNLTG